MAKKAEYAARKKDESDETVKGYIYGMFGIDKRGPGYFVLTHIPSGTLVCSGTKLKELTALVTDEEFENECWEKKEPTKDDVARLAKVISRYYSM